LAVFGVLLLVVSAGFAGAQGQRATAQLEDTSGNQVGTAEFVEGPNGVTITANLQPGQDAAGPGEHGVHIHETGDVTPDFEAAGEHLNPTGAEHGLQNPNGPHAGDLPGMTVNEDGSASYQTTTDLATLSGVDRAILDSDGSTLVIHRGADDQETDPTGNTGGRAIAGVIQEAVTLESTTPEATIPRQPLPSSGGIDLLALMALAGGAGLISAVLIWRWTARGEL
jgi:superoxide dismutase, Cu-Zn family